MSDPPTNLPPTQPECPGCAAAAKRTADLEARVAAVEQALSAAARAGKRQAAPSS